MNSYPKDGFVGVHIGAGQHSESRTELYLSVCRSACRVAVSVLGQGGSALEAATAATIVLEDAGETNAGLGSNLTESGSVEMDAGLMDGDSLLFGAVGAVPGIKNPILIAQKLVEEQKKGFLPLGRVPPGFLVGEGAKNWAVRHGIPSVSPSSLISEKALKLYHFYKRKLDEYTDITFNSNNKRLLEKEDDDEEVENEDDKVTDTVGVVVLDSCGNVASSVSSGGIALKQPGRIGQAASFGCGCWAQNKMGKHGSYSIGTSTTGCGEHLVRTFLAREAAIALGNSDIPCLALERVMREKFENSVFLSSIHKKLGGAICLHFDTCKQRGEFLWTHTTASMGIAYQTTKMNKAIAKMSRLPFTSSSSSSSSPPSNKRNLHKNSDNFLLLEGVPFKFSSGSQ